MGVARPAAFQELVSDGQAWKEMNKHNIISSQTVLFMQPLAEVMQRAVSSSMPKSLKNSQAKHTYNRIGWAMSAICWHHLQRLAS